MTLIKIATKVETAFIAPTTAPNGMNASPEGLWMIDQITDDAYLVDQKGKILRRILTESGNSSGLAYGQGHLWVALNGGRRNRPERPTDRYGFFILKISPVTGKTLSVFELSGEGRVHGLEWNRGKICVTRPGAKIIQLMELNRFRIIREIEVSHDRSHGLAWDGDGLWCVFTSEGLVIKYNVITGKEMAIIDVPSSNPEVHGLTIWKGCLWYCDAKSGTVYRIRR